MSLTPAPCHHQVQHQHGDINAYLQDGCRCDPCKDANTANTQAWRATRQVGMVPAGRARTHIQRLLATGHTWHSIGQAAGLDPLTVQAILEGVPSRAEAPRQRIRSATEHHILGVLQTIPYAA